MDVLKDLVKRLEKLENSKDPIEAKALREWLESGGLASLQPSMIEEMKEVEAEAVKTITLPVRLFDTWEEHKYEVYPYTTVAELEKTIAQGFGLRKDSLTLRFVNDADVYEIPDVIAYSRDDTLGEIAHNASADPDDTKVVVLPFLDDFEAWAKQGKSLSLPVRVFLPPRGEEQFGDVELVTLPITMETEVKNIADELKKTFPIDSHTAIVFVDPANQYPRRYNIHTSINVWKEWKATDLFEVQIAIGPEP